MTILAELIGIDDDTGKERYKCIVENCTNFIVFGSKDREFYKKKLWVDANGEVIKPKRCKFHREEGKRFREKQRTQLTPTL